MFKKITGFACLIFVLFVFNIVLTMENKEFEPVVKRTRSAIKKKKLEKQKKPVKSTEKIKKKLSKEDAAKIVTAAVKRAALKNRMSDTFRIENFATLEAEYANKKVQAFLKLKDKKWYNKITSFFIKPKDVYDFDDENVKEKSVSEKIYSKKTSSEEKIINSIIIKLKDRNIDLAFAHKLSSVISYILASNSKSIKKIDISLDNTQLKDNTLNKIFEYITVCRNNFHLKLSLQNNSIAGKDIKNFYNFLIKNSKTITCLDLNFNKNSSMKNIDLNFLSRLSSLWKLHLDFGLTGLSQNNFFGSLSKNNLTKLSIIKLVLPKKCSINVFIYFKDLIQQNPRLTEFFISAHNIAIKENKQAEILKEFFTQLSLAKNLKALNIDFNNFKINEKEKAIFFSSCENLFKCLKKLETLVFNLSKNGKLKDEYVANIVKGISPLTKIKNLNVDLSHNSISGEQILFLVSILENKKSLQIVNLNVFSEEFSTFRKFAYTNVLSKPWVKYVGAGLAYATIGTVITILCLNAFPVIISGIGSVTSLIPEGIATTLVSKEVISGIGTFGTPFVFNKISPSAVDMYNKGTIDSEKLKLSIQEVACFASREREALYSVAGGFAAGSVIASSENVQGALIEGANKLGSASAKIGVGALTAGAKGLKFLTSDEVKNAINNGIDLAGYAGGITLSAGSSVIKLIGPKILAILIAIPTPITIAVAVVLTALLVCWYYDIGYIDIRNWISGKVDYVYYDMLTYVGQNFDKEFKNIFDELENPIYSIEKVRQKITSVFLNNIIDNVNNGSLELLNGVDTIINQMQTKYRNLYDEDKETLTKINKLIEIMTELYNENYFRNVSEDQLKRKVEKDNLHYLLESPDKEAEISFAYETIIDLYHSERLEKIKKVFENRVKSLDDTNNQFSRIYEEMKGIFGELCWETRKNLTELFVALQNSYKDNEEDLKRNILDIKTFIKDLYTSTQEKVQYVSSLEEKYKKAAKSEMSIKKQAQDIKNNIIEDLGKNKPTFSIESSFEEFYETYRGGKQNILAAKTKYNYDFFEQLYNDAAILTGSKTLRDINIEGNVKSFTKRYDALDAKPIKRSVLEKGMLATVGGVVGFLTTGIFKVMANIDYKKILAPDLEITLNDSLVDKFATKINNVVKNIEKKSFVKFDFNMGNMNNITNAGLNKLEDLIIKNEDTVKINTVIGEFTRINKNTLNATIKKCPGIVTKR